ncbi:MAG: type VI secretion system tip protein VgrG [Flavobacteriaceae bacterium]|nr:type VI secretion system tip protein VgrG [Flavobacteriaceae bacterium]
MATTKRIETGDLVTFTIYVNGKAIDDIMRVLSVDVEFEVNKISTAKIVLLDGDASTGKFEASSSSTFVPGNEISIDAGYDSKNKTIFKGIITSQNIRINGTEGSFLELTCRDKAVAMIVGRKSLTFSKKTDGDVMTSIIGNYSGVTSDVTSTSIEIPQLVQYNTTDWDFVMSRAETNGLIVTCINGKVTVAKPNADTSPVLRLTYGTDIHEFNGDLNSINQLSSVKASSWDYTTQAVIDGEGKNDFPGAGNISSKKLSEVVGLSSFQLQTSAPLSSGELTNWSKAQLIKSELSKFQGEVTCQGTDLPLPGKFVSFAGLGDRFNGDHFVSRVYHTIAQGNWITEISFGLSKDWFIEQNDVMSPPASGLLPGVNGLFTATVKKMYEDPDNQFRILVDIPLFDTNGEGLWARQANFYSTSNAGAFFLPEVGDEVVVGFLNEDPRYPIIIGSLYSSTKNEPFEGLVPNEKNSTKAIVTKSGIEIIFDDENKVFTIVTPNKNTAVFSDKEKSITIQDQNNNSIVMSDSGIVMKSPKDISIEADQTVTIKGTQGVSIESSGGDVSTNAMNIRESADMEYSAEGSASASVRGGGELTLKGAMVMIN